MSSRNTIIATAQTVQTALDRPEAVDGIGGALPKDPLKAAAMLGLLGRVRASISAAQAEVGDGILAAPHSHDPHAREAAVLLSLMASEEGGQVTSAPLTQGGQEAKFDTRDWLGWITVAFEKMKHWRPHPILRPAPRIDPFPDRGRVALLGDWGTNLYGAPICARTIATDPEEFVMLLHLGDVYYSGTRAEVKSRFLDVWPSRRDAGLIQRTLNSNHEMYSGGDAYFQDSLPFFRQDASYFALANERWLLIGLDTAYVDHDMDEQQVEWLRAILDDPQAAGKKAILFSHQQLFSRLDAQGVKLAEDTKLGQILREGRVHAWYWGHEHRCVIYESHPGFGGLLARCTGHAGMPETRRAVAPFPVANTVASAKGDPVCWRRFDALSPGSGGMLAPAGVVLDGRNRYIPGEEEKFAPHGYMTLRFDGAELFEQVLTPDRDVVHEQRVG